MAESHDTAATQKNNGNTSKKRKRQGWQHNVSTVCHNEEMANAIERSMKKAKQILHRTHNPANPHCHRAIVCILCDWFIVGTETIHKLTNNQISKHSNRLSVQTYKSCHGQVLKPELRKQYQVNVDGLKDMLLLPQSRKYNNCYATCACCYKGMCPNLANKRTLPKFAIANGFMIGSFPREIEYTNMDGKRNVRDINDNELTDLLKAMLASVRPYGCVFAYSGGSQKSIRGNYQFFEMDQNRLGAVINHLNQAGIGEHIYCVLCGRMTTDQKQIVRRRAVVDTQLLIDILTWFVKESGHPGFQNTTAPEECPKPLFVENQGTTNNTDKSVNVNVENNIESGTYCFSSAQEPSENTSVYGLPDKFALAMFSIQHSRCWHTVALTPTLRK
jgi:hypothetical protein